MKKMTKAERIFNDTYTACRVQVKAWGMERNPNGRPIGFNGLETEEVTSRRTWNVIEKLIKAESKQIELSVQYGIISNEKAEMKRFALEMVQVTLENEIAKWA